MENLSVIFLGERYTLPTDIVTYYKYFSEFDDLRQDLLSFMLKSFPDCNNFPNDVAKIIHDKFREIGNLCIKKLYSRGIYSRTIDDYVEENAGLTEIRKALVDVVSRQIEITLEEVNSVNDAAERAEVIANSSITGMGFSIYSSDLIALGVWAAMENKELKKQAKRADEMYNEMLNEAKQSSASIATRKNRELNSDTWLPRMKSSVDIFIFSLLDTFIQDLINAEMFDSNALKHIDAQRSQKLLEGITYAPDQKALIREAFYNCPFCIDVYILCVELGYFDLSCANASKAFHVADIVKEYVSQKISRTFLINKKLAEKQIREIVAPLANSLAAFDGTTGDACLVKHFISLRSKRYLELKELQQDSKTLEFNKLIRTAIAPTVEQIIIKCEEAPIDVYYKKYIENVLFSDDLPYYADIINSTVLFLVEETQKYLMRAKKRIALYNTARIAHKDFEEEFNRKMWRYEKEKSRLGIFNFSRKRELEEKMALLKKQRSDKLKELSMLRDAIELGHDEY